MKVGVYLRVSTASQTVENQEKQLKQFAKSRGWEIVRIYKDEGWSGDSKSRPAFTEMIDAAHKREFDTILVFQLSRFGRSMSEVIKNITELKSSGVAVYSYSENLSTAEDSPYGKIVLAVLCALGEIELDLIRERVRLGVQRAQSNGVKFGRPHKGFDLGKALEMKKQGLSMRKIAKALDVSHMTLRRRFEEIQGVTKVGT